MSNYIDEDKLDQLDQENKELIIHNKKLSDIIFDAEVRHYRSRNIEEAIKLNSKLKITNDTLATKVEDIYDI